jgi:hypothetical protein
MDYKFSLSHKSSFKAMKVLLISGFNITTYKVKITQVYSHIILNVRVQLEL